MPDSVQPVGPNLPQFDDKKVYLVTGKSLNAMTDAIKSNQPKAVSGGGLKVAQKNDQGTFLALDPAKTTTLNVCINGTAVSKTFVTLN